MTQFLFIWDDVLYLDSFLHKTTRTEVLAGVNCHFFNEAKK